VQRLRWTADDVGELDITRWSRPRRAPSMHWWSGNERRRRTVAAHENGVLWLTINRFRQGQCDPLLRARRHRGVSVRTSTCRCMQSC
jgi:hypothetical protein